MKKQFLIATTVFLLGGILFLTGCKKDDTSAPVITLNGSATDKSILNATYTDPGATANDDQDGAVVVTSSGTVNINLAGTYVITYSASDAAGNPATATRTVTVYNEADYLIGGYNADDTCALSTVLPYNATIATSTTTDKQFTIQNFGGFGQTVYVTATVSGTAVGSTFSWQTQKLDVATNLLAAATNIPSVTSLSPVKLVFSYQWSMSGGANELCTSTYIHK